MDADPYCSLQHPGGAADYDYVVGAGGGLKWAFVYVKEGLAGAYTAPATQVVLDQRGCAYSPHVFGIMAGQDLKILNSDETLHNIHSLPAASRQFNLAMPRVGMELTQKFTAKEVMVRIKCDVHPWMECWAGVLDHPFHAVSGDDGSFSIDRLPAGTYTIEAWHEEGGTLTQTVTVAEGAAQEITFSFKPAV
jgi:plastocyanin